MLPYLILILLILPCCNKLEDYQWFRYAETGCSDRWRNFPHTTNEELKDAVKTYMKNNSIDVLVITIGFDSSLVETCKSCECRTGKFIDLQSEISNDTFLCSMGFTKR